MNAKVKKIIFFGFVIVICVLLSRILIHKQKSPVPFNTTALQSESYSQFKYSPRQTLRIAEGLYQAGVISYPRSSLNSRISAALDFFVIEICFRNCVRSGK